MESLNLSFLLLKKSHEVLEKDTSVEEEPSKIKVEEPMGKSDSTVHTQADVLENIVRNSMISEVPSNVDGPGQADVAKKESIESGEVQTSVAHSEAYQEKR